MGIGYSGFKSQYFSGPGYYRGWSRVLRFVYWWSWGRVRSFMLQVKVLLYKS